MLNETPSCWSKIITSVKVVALATVLGTVVIAAEQRLASVSTEPTVAAATSQVAPADKTQAAASDYFPAQFPAPKGDVSEPAPSF
jgi:hypothetical protein